MFTDINLPSLMPDEDNNFGDSLVLDFKITITSRATQQFNMADRELRNEFFEKLSVNGIYGKEEVDNAAGCFAICSGCTGTRIAKFLLSLCRDQIYVCSKHKHNV